MIATHTDRADRGQRCRALFRFLDEQRIEFCVTAPVHDDACDDGPGRGHGRGDLRGEADDVALSRSGRLEVVLPAADSANMAAAVKLFCNRNEIELVSSRASADGSMAYGLSWWSGTVAGEQRAAQFMVLALHSNYCRRGRIVFTAQELLHDRVPAPQAMPCLEGAFLAAPAKAFICHLLRCIDAGAIEPGDGRHLGEQWRQDPHGALRQVHRFWSREREGGIVARAAESGNWEPVRIAAGALQAALRQRKARPASTWTREQWLRFRHWRHPSGMLIACLGPQGSGKRSVIRLLGERPPGPFRHVDTMQLRPHLMRPGPSARPAPGEGEPPAADRRPRGRLGTMAKLALFAADYWAGYWWRIRPTLRRGVLVVSDRYFDDVLVNPRRYRMERPRAFARLLLPWIPRPELWLVFDLSPRVLRRRRAGMADPEAVRQRGEYRRVLRGRENVVVLDASAPLEEVVAQAERAILGQLARRTARRLGMRPDTLRNPRSTKLLLYFCRRNVPLLSRLVRVAFNSDIDCRLRADVHLPHPYGIVIHPQAVIGHRVTLMQQVTIGDKDRSESVAPVIGDDVYIGAGARILGDVRIGNAAVVGANAVVTRDIPPGATVVGANRIVADKRDRSTHALPARVSVARFAPSRPRGPRGIAK